MDNAIMQLLNQDLAVFIASVFIIMSGIISGYTIITKFFEIIGKPLKWVRKKNKDHELLLNTSNELRELYILHEESVKQSILHDKKIQENVEILTKNVSDLFEKITNMEARRDKDKLAEYKDKIGQYYRLYVERKFSAENPIPYWNKMEKESLEELIEQYESHGGTNSFVHSVVEPEMQKWKIIDINIGDDYE